MKKYSLLITFLIVLNTFSQSYKGNLDTIKETGLHTILLAPEIRSAMKENFNFLRIEDNNKNEVPYVLIKYVDKNLLHYQPSNIASKESIKDSVTSIIIENKTQKLQESLILKIGNTNIKKRYTIYGSNNKINWFGLEANSQLTFLKSTEKTVIEKNIHFPLNNYKFLRIDFNDKESLPLNIISIGTYKNEFLTQKPIKINDFTENYINDKEKKVTKIRFSFNDFCKIDIISFAIKTRFFNRKARLMVKKKRKIKKRIEIYNEVIAEFQLNSKKENIFNVSHFNAKEFTIEIENQDNPVLDIKHIHFFQKPLYLIANLKSKIDYNLIIDSTLKKPHYDLENFINTSTKTIDIANVINFSRVKNVKIKKQESFLKSKNLMWICIIIGGLIVIYFSINLLKDVKK